MSLKSKDPNNILNSTLEKAKTEIKKDDGKTFFQNLNDEEKRWINVVTRNASEHKGVLTVLITSLVKKIENCKVNFLT